MGSSFCDRRGIAGVIFAFLMLLVSCTPAVAPVAKKEVLAERPGGMGNEQVILDFEKPDPEVEWAEYTGRPRGMENEATTQAATQGSASADLVLGRSAVRPLGGLWSLKATVGEGHQGDVVHRFAKPRDMQGSDTVLAGIMQAGNAGRNGEMMARVFLVDDKERRIYGDPLPVASRWQELMLDLNSEVVQREGGEIDLGAIAAIGVELRRVHGTEVVGSGEAMEVQTDSWRATRNFRAYQGQRLGAAKSFYVEREGTELHVGMVGSYDVTFYNRSGWKRPWMSVKQQGREDLAMGWNSTGLMLLDQERYDRLGAGIRQDADDGSGVEGAGNAEAPMAGWPVAMGSEGVPSEETRWHWEVVWTSSVGAIVEVKQEVGPYDRLGEAAAKVMWRFMIYQWGQVFVHAQWNVNKSAGLSEPMTWALVQVDGGKWVNADAGAIHANSAKDADRLLNAIYPVSVTSGLATALPHQMQRGAVVAMIGKSGGGREKNLWWWAKPRASKEDGRAKEIFGVGLTGSKEDSGADCMLLVNSPTGLVQAGSFAQYLVPAKVKMREGELDRNFPGDVDNDGLVDSYGFQVVRLSKGRATFMVYPQERPLFYPPYLFTVPAVEREAVDLKHSRLLVNIDGKQFADPPQFPDGSFLLQLPLVIDRPVQVEAVVVRR